MNRQPMARRHWPQEPRPSRWRPVLGALAWALVVLIGGVQDVRW